MRVLICDDNPDAAATLEIVVGLNRHETCVCTDGIDCLEKARSWRPDVALLDIGMPGMSGYAIAEALRRSDLGAAILLIAITGWGTAHDIELAKAAGFDLHFTKPADPSQILSALENRR